MNYGYAPLQGEVPPAIAVPANSAKRNGLQLYAPIATSGRRGTGLGGLEILEIGSGGMAGCRTMPLCLGSPLPCGGCARAATKRQSAVCRTRVAPRHL